MHHLTLHQLCVSASPCHISLLFLFFNNTAPPEIYTLSLHDALPIASHLAVMRSTLLPGLVQTLRANLTRGEAHVRIFEIGRCFHGTEPDLQVQPERIAGLAYGTRLPEQWGARGTSIDFFDAKGDV